MSTLRSVQMIESSFAEKRVTSTSPEPDRNIQSGTTIQPTETLLVLCLLAQRPSRPETELYVPARSTPAAWESGERTCDSVTAARCESEESSRLAENLNCEIRTLRLSLPLCCRTSNTLGRYSVIFVRRVRAKPIYYDWCLHAGAYKP